MSEPTSPTQAERKKSRRLIEQTRNEGIRIDADLEDDRYAKALARDKNKDSPKTA